MEKSGEHILGRIHTHPVSKAICLLLLCLWFAQGKTLAVTDAASNKNSHSADSLLSEAKQLFRQSPNDALNLSLEAVELYKIEENDSGMAAGYNVIGAYYEITGAFDKALYYYQKALGINKSIDKQQQMAKNQNNIGNIYLQQGNYERALENYFEAMMFFENDNNKLQLISINTNVGLIYKNTGNLNEALSYYKNALDMCVTINDSSQLAAILYNTANIYLEIEDYSSALDTYKKSAEIKNLQKDHTGLARSLIALGNTHEKLEEYRNAKNSLNEALKLSRQLNIEDQEAQALLHLGYVNYQTGNYSEAQSFFDKSLAIALELNLSSLVSTNYFYHYKSDSALGNMASAFANQSLYYEHLKTPVEFNPDAKLKELQERYNYIRQEQIETHNRLRTSRTLNSYLICGLVALILFSLLIMQYIKLKNEKKINELTQKNLRSQINPHFIFNILNSIQYYIMRNDQEASIQYLHKFASLLRITLDNSRSEIVPIHDEVESLKLYLELEAMRLEHKLDFTINIDNEIDDLMFKIPPLILQPFVENSIIHGIQKKKGPGSVQINLQLRKNTIHCMIEDDGVGRKSAKQLQSENQRKRKSHGKDITETRLNLLNSLYGKKLGVAYSDITDNNKQTCGTRVEFDLPLLN